MSNEVIAQVHKSFETLAHLNSNNLNEKVSSFTIGHDDVNELQSDSSDSADSEPDHMHGMKPKPIKMRAFANPSKNEKSKLKDSPNKRQKKTVMN